MEEGHTDEFLRYLRAYFEKKTNLPGHFIKRVNDLTNRVKNLSSFDVNNELMRLCTLEASFKKMKFMGKVESLDAAEMARAGFYACPAKAISSEQQLFGAGHFTGNTQSDMSCHDPLLLNKVIQSWSQHSKPW